MNCQKYSSKIEVNEQTGKRCLLVYYDREADNFNEATAQALADHGLEPGQITSIALPVNMAE